MNKRFFEIRSRKEEIRKTLQSDEKVDLKGLQEELRALDAEQKEIEEREKVANGINIGSNPEGTYERQKPKSNEVTKGIESEEYRKAFMNYVVRGIAIPAEFRDATATTDASALIPPTTLNRVVERLRTYGNILPLVTRTAYKSGLAIPTSEVKPVATWVAEGATSNKQKKTFGTVTFSHYKLRCAVAVTLEAEYMTLSAFEDTIVSNIAEAMAIALEESIIKGSGTGQPTGIIKDTSKGTSINVAKLGLDTIVKAEAAVAQAYEAGSVWVMTKSTFMQFMGMTDSAGQPIARVNAGINGVPERVLMGRNVVLCDYLPDFSTELKKSDVFAFIYRMKDYVLNTNYNVSMKVYEDNDTDDLVRKSIMIADGRPIDFNSLVLLTGNKTA
ncbi:phage major capsid protein [uncultured Veillonella sp.]|uniref:phage major capsid protein n=1 Tax=uncultured Veillonella sp. TaxID=159268 RepID=UPI002599D85F|nr:phage major capsid protein [uncultured Veillonella sp.]